ncbi:MAG: anti-sigma factor [Algiphilus sp.]
MSPHDPTSENAEATAVQERDLMALADGRVATDSVRAARIHHHLRKNPAAATRVQAWQHQNAAIRTYYGGVMAEEVPDCLQPATLRAQRAAVHARQRRFAVAVCALLALAAVLRMLAFPQATEDARLDRFAGAVAELSTEDAASLHDAAASPRAATDTQRGTALPDLGRLGFSLQSQRIVTAGVHATTEARYQDAQGRALRLFVTEEDNGQPPELHRRVQDGHEIVYWRAGHRLYALAAETPLASGDLEQIARVTRLRDSAMEAGAVLATRGEDKGHMPAQSPPVAMEERHPRVDTAPARPASVHYEGMVKDSSL